MGERPATSLRGRRLGEFVVGDRLGGGGFADVYRASQPSLERAAVIKILRGAATPQQVRRFEQEARMACQLDHPYAAHVYAFGVERDGLLWIAMELVRGISLAEWLETKGPIPLGRFTGLFERLCGVVHTAHQAGLVHRDIKPANVMVVTRAGKLMPKLLDFGIATDAYGSRSGAPPAAAVRSLEDTGADDSTDPMQSDNRRASGTPAYMAPEQWTGRHDHRVDIYALGVLAYRCLTGRPPITGTSAREFYDAHRHQAVPLLGEQPVELDAAIAKALAKDPRARYQSALELATAFKHAAGDTAWLPDDVMRPWLASAPPHLAACVVAVGSARTLEDACEAARRLLEACAQWLGVVAMTATASLGAYVGEIAHVRALRDGPLAARAWLELAAALCAPYAERDEDFPIPEMVRWFVDEAGPETVLAALAAARSGAAAFPRELVARVVHGLRFFWGYTLMVGGDEWTSSRSARPGGAVWISDGDHNPIFELSPLVAAAEPAPGEPCMVFAIGGGRKGARQTAQPQGYEREAADVGPWLEAHYPSASKPRDATIVDRAPYRGLAPFSTEDAELFFGRTRLVDQIYNRVLAQPFTALTGPSGSGKSSLVFAGLVPRLPDEWIVVTIRPGRSPIAALQAALDETGLAGDLQILVAWLYESRRRLLIVVDQAEELLTLAGQQERAGASARLAELVDAGGDRVRVIVTLRHDFIERADELPAWRELVQRNLLFATVPSQDELAEVIAAPARHVGYDFDDPQLVQDMVAEVAGRPSALPLLSFAASRLWDERDPQSQRMTRAAYVAMGGVTGALARYAEEVYSALSPRRQTLVRELLRRLVTARGTSAPARRDELATLGNDMAAVVEALIAARILVASERTDGGEHVAIAHEALIDLWPRLVQWRAGDATGARHLDELRAAAELWSQHGRDASYLLRGAALAIYRHWAPRWAGALTAAEAAFGEASVRAATRARRARRAAIAIAIAALSTAIVVLVVLYDRADRNRRDAEQRFTDMLVDRGRAELLADRPLRALVYLTAAYERGRDGASLRVALGLAARAMDREVSRVHAHAKPLFDITAGDVFLSTASGDDARSWTLRDGRLEPMATYHRSDGEIGDAIATGGRDLATGGLVGSVVVGKALVVFDANGRQRAVAQPPGFMTKLTAGPTLIATDLDNEIALWDRDAKLQGVLANPARPPGAKARSLAEIVFADSGPRILLVFRTGWVEMWNASDRSVVWQVDVKASLEGGSIVGDRALVATDTGAFLMVEDGNVVYRGQAHTATLWSHEVAPDGRSFVTVGNEPQIKFWNAGDGTQTSVLTERAIRPHMLTLDRGGGLLAVSDAKTVALWDVKAGLRLGTIDPGRPLACMVFSSDGKYLITGDSGGWIKTWDVRPEVIARSFEHTAEVWSVALTPNGKIVSTSDNTRVIRHWELAGGAPVGSMPRYSPSARMAYLDDGRLATPYEAHVALWDVARSSITALFPGNTASVAVHGEHVAVASMIAAPTFQAVVWDARTQRIVAHHELEEGTSDLAFLPSGHRVALLGATRVRVWDLDTDQIAWTAEVPNSTVDDLDVSRDGRFVAATGDDGYVRIWHAETGEVFRSIKQPGVPSAVAFSPDGTLLAVADSDHDIYLWDALTGQLGGTLRGHEHFIPSLVFTADGKQLVSASRDHRVLVWNVPYERRTPPELAKLVAERVPFQLVGTDLVDR